MAKIHHKAMIDINGKPTRFTLADLAMYHILRIRQSKGEFFSIQKVGKFYGEGQSGGRAVENVAREVENQLIEQMGIEKYQRQVTEYIENYIEKHNLDWKKVK
jgi:hypothetical protein